MKKYIILFNLIIFNLISFGQPINDNCSNSILLTVDTVFSPTQYTTINATVSSGIPAPDCGNTNLNDVWFSAIVPSSGKLIVRTTVGTLNFAALAIYRGIDCSNLALIECQSSSSSYEMPSISRNDLIPGETIYIRFWSSIGNFGTFNIGVLDFGPNCGSSNTLPSDQCSDAPLITNFTGYCFTTSSLSTADSPLINGCGEAYSIENNIWLKFIAPTNLFSLSVWVYNCKNDNGVQFALLEGNCDTGFTSIQCSQNPSGNYTKINLDINNIIAGNEYYIMIDGYAGDICDITFHGDINVGSGADTSICFGTNAQLIATGGDSYLWSPSTGLSSNVVSNPIASPIVSTTYNVSITNSNGVYYDQVVVDVMQPPTLNSERDISICNGDTAIIFSDCNSATSYLWNTLDTLPAILVQPTVSTTYVVQSSNLCGTLTDDIIVTVKSIPTSSFSVSPDYVEQGATSTFTYTGSANQSATFNWDFDGGVVLSGSGIGPYEVQWNENRLYVVSLEVIEDYCSSIITMDTLTFDSGINLSNNKINLTKLFPNPASSNFNILFNSNQFLNLSLTIYNTELLELVRTEVELEKGENNFLVNIDNLESGCYYVKIYSQDKSFNYVSKLIVIR